MNVKVAIQKNIDGITCFDKLFNNIIMIIKGVFACRYKCEENI